MLRRRFLGAALAAFWISRAHAQSTINGIPSQSIYPSGPMRANLTTSSGTATFNYAAAGFTVAPTVECTVENASTTVAYVAQIANKSPIQAMINVLNSQAPALSGNILNIANIVIGQPFAASSSTPVVNVDCIAAMPTQ